MAKTVDMGLNESKNGTAGLNPYCGYADAFKGYLANYCGKPSKLCTYNSSSKMTFRRPSKNSFYMQVLRNLKRGPASKQELGIVNRNLSLITAMRSAGMIDYAKSANVWTITAAGLNYLNRAEKLLKNN